MRKVYPKNMAPLLMLRILEERSDENHPLTRDEIERILDEEYGITLERKAFFRHMRSIGAREDEDLDADEERIADIRRVVTETKDDDGRPCAGFYFSDHKFTELELRVIIDALAGSPYLSQKETKELVQRLAALGSYSFQKKMAIYQFIGKGRKTENRNLMLNLEIIDEAINENKQISFDILCYDTHGKQVPSDQPKVVCTPIRYFVKDRSYYLVAAKTVDADLLQYKSFDFKEGDLQLEAYALSNIDSVEKLDLRAQNYRSIPDFRQGMDWQKFIQNHPTMELLWFKPDRCTFLCLRSMIEDIKARYGDDLRVRRLNDKEFEKIDEVLKGNYARDSVVLVSVTTDRYDAAEFARGYSFGMWVISPRPARAIARSLSLSQLKHYDRLEQSYITEDRLPPLNLSYTPINAPQEES